MDQRISTMIAATASVAGVAALSLPARGQNPYRGTPQCFNDPQVSALRCRWAGSNQNLYIYQGLGNYSYWDGNSGFNFAPTGSPANAHVEFEPYPLNLPFTGYAYVYVGSLCWDYYSRAFFEIYFAYLSYSSGNVATKAALLNPPWDSTGFYTAWVGAHEMGHALGLNHYGQLINGGGFENVYIDYNWGVYSDVMRSQSYFFGTHATPLPHDFDLLDLLYPLNGFSSCS